MPVRLLRVLAVTYFIYLYLGPLRIALYNRDLNKVLSFFQSFENFILASTTFIAFMAYSAGTYLILINVRRPFLKALSILMMIPLGILFRFILQEVICLNLFGFGNYYAPIDPYNYFTDNLYYAFIYCSAGAFTYYNQKAAYTQLNNQKLLVENQKTQLTALRAQLNPHFVFNTLNNISSLINSGSNKALFAIQQLAPMLRYSTYEAKGQSSLYKELDFMQRQLELEKLRYKDTIYIHFPEKNSLENVNIPPFILIPFFENALKHGLLTDPLKPVEIVINLNNEGLFYKVTNSFKSKEIDTTGGIGLQNLEKRLYLMFGDEIEFSTQKTHDTFEARLKIPLQ